jgi:outer membrane protein assembly factor BamB
MRSRPRGLALVAVSTLAASGVAFAIGASLRAQPAVEGWPMAGGDGAHTGVASGPSAPYREAWRRPVEGGVVAGPVVADDVVVVLTPAAVVAVDTGTGGPRWSVPRSEGPAGAPAAAEELVVHASGDARSGTLIARSVDDGAMRWRAHVGEALEAPFVAGGGLVFAGTSRGTVVGFDAATGEERFRFEADGVIRSAPAVAGDLVIAAWEQPGAGRATVRAFSIYGGGDDGPRWQMTTDPGPFPSAAVSVGSGAAVVAAGDGTARAIGLRNGAERWRARLSEVATALQLPVTGPPLVVADRLHVARLDPESGRQLWAFRLADARTLPGGQPNSLAGSAPLVAGTDAVIGDTAGVVSAVDVRSGRRVWRADVAEGPIGPPAADGDRVYLAVLGSEGALIALEQDPAGRRLDEVSETVLRPVEAVANFAIASLAVSAVILGVFRYLLRGRRRPEEPA